MVLLVLSLLILTVPSWANSENGLGPVLNILDKGDFRPDPLSCNFRPPVTEGEAKVTFNCSDFPTPQEVNTETITFYDQLSGTYLKDHGIVLRSRKSIDGKKSDMTVKFRPESNSDLNLNPDLYYAMESCSKLEKKAAKKENRKKNYEMKCESDVSYGDLVDGLRLDNENGESCSFTIKGITFAGSDHTTFLNMVGAPGVVGPDGRIDLSVMKKTEVLSKSWDEPQAGIGTDGLAFERWEVNGSCILEVSAKFKIEEIENEDHNHRLGRMKIKYDQVIKSILSKYQKFTPLDKQGKKTNWAKNQSVIHQFGS